MLFLVVLVIGVLYVVSESFGYKPASRLAQVGIPTYSLVMAVVTLVHDPAQWPWVFLAVPVGMAIGWFQTTHVRVRRTGDRDRRGRRTVEVRRGWSYALGWLLVFVCGVAFHAALDGVLPWDEVLDDLASDVARDIFSFLLLTSGLSWYVWALSGSAGYTYALVLRLTDPAVAEALHEAPRPGHGEGWRPSPLQRLLDRLGPHAS
ncbi:hypothetical protein [Caniella muris]|uniref:hypothetical protein n=1 Tax=Caniella muris TaxID=2941502 RepID=UPI00203D71C9|nr:hypothetical protein [Caniella muris]